ncbi:MAG TPA: potassium/proton antiporter [Vicinamibacterales bacterium]|nr:potassium/proton antiporter [Vicinamibacterales bacterium]
MLSANPLIFLAAVLLLAGVLLSKTSSRLGVPSLLLFLGLGMLAGSEGLLGIEFEDFALAQRYGIIALAFILFSGGAGTAWRDIRRVLVPGVALATVGVLLSAIVLGAIAAAILGLELLEGMLLGSVIASTDAAAVFSILRSRGVAIIPRLRHLLELESGSNDPAAVFLTVGMIALIQRTSGGATDLVGLFVVQMGVGLVAGWLLARGAVALINRLRLEYDGLYPVMTVAFVVLTYEGTAWLGGSGFVATYVAGLTIANAEFLHKRSLLRFHDAIAWLMQISMFVLMGLLVFPSDLVPVAGQAVLVGAVLLLVARPLAVVLTLIPFRLPAREIAFVSWVGLRGATPIILATFPVVAGVANGKVIFDVVFFVVLLSVLVQGTTIPAAAKRLGLATKLPAENSYTFDAVIAGDEGHGLRELTIPEGAPAAGRSIVSLGLPAGVLVVLLYRAGQILVPQGGTVLEAGDRVLLLAEEDTYPAARDRLAGSGEREG